MIYLGDLVPERCEICSTEIVDEFFDARTAMGPWANMCRCCFKNGPGLNKLGTGVGQHYQKQSDGRWMKCNG